MEQNKDWNYNKRVRELLNDINRYEIHAQREIENNKKCRPDKIRDNSQRYLQICINKYEEFSGEKYK
jgi:hypothetical protein